MARVTYIAADGAVRTIDIAEGYSVMEGAVEQKVAGVDGDCGGNCACATCHVYVDPDWVAATGERSPAEAAMLAHADAVAPNSRLGCQIVLSPALDGLVVRTPASQH
ncbi:MAG: 2Fe-2S iron-sulfur cluster-binding protein [Janthinobacterium lividum]